MSDPFGQPGPPAPYGEPDERDRSDDGDRDAHRVDAPGAHTSAPARPPAGPYSAWPPVQVEPETTARDDEPRVLSGAPRRRGPLLNVVLFLLTLGTTTYWGFIQYQLFYLEDIGSLVLNPLTSPRLLLAGVPFGLAVIAFLLAHEMGHYLACRYYRIPATLPFFIPIPPVQPFILLPGTMGAVIRILGPLKNRRALFDVAIAGPIAGFFAALPILAVGISRSRVAETEGIDPGSIQMGEPLIWGPLQQIFGPPMADGQTLIAHPLAFVGWFALLVTAMNLLPVGQLDGGHLLYALVPRYHRVISLLVVALMAYAGFVYFVGWIFFALLVLLVIGTRHPRPLAFESSLGPGRWILAFLAAVIFVTCFMLVPVTIELG